ncbi:MAG: tRNA pseudouridine(38-40) synthase TruA [Nitrosomonadaceae bacterium]
MRIVLGLEYDGCHFCGWQGQPSGCSIQDTLEAALSRIAHSSIQVITAGRTDAGVHATYQVVHFDTQAQRPLSAWVRGVNALLPNSMAVLWVSKSSDNFHARYSATERCYLYLLLNHPVRAGLYHGKVGWFHLPLNLERMRDAAQILLGEHDFSAFRAAECQAKSPVRNVTKLEIIQQGDIIAFEIRANAFLYHMVRNIIGSLVYVGKGKYSPQWMRELLESRDRSHAAPTFSATGLYLAGITYDPKWKLPCFIEPPLAAVLPRVSRARKNLFTNDTNTP